MRWLPSRAHDNGMFLVFSNGVGVDDDKIRTGNAMVLDPHGEIIAESRALGDDMVVADLDASLLPTSSGRRWLGGAPSRALRGTHPPHRRGDRDAASALRGVTAPPDFAAGRRNRYALLWPSSARTRPSAPAS